MTTSSTPIKILISGGGIAGSCLAYWLSRISLPHQITIIERSPTPRVTGQAVDIREQAIQIIELMGLKETILGMNTTETGTAFVGVDGKILGVFEMVPGDSSPTSEFEILRGDLARIFLEAAKKRRGVEYIYGETIESLTQTGTGVAITFSGGKAPETYDLVVGADGARSKTRSLAFDPAMAANPYHPSGMYVAYFSIPSRPDDADNKLWYWYNATKGRVVMTRPHQNPKTIGAYLCYTMPVQTQKDAGIEQAMARGSDALKKVFRQYFEGAGWETERVLEGMEHADDFYAAAWEQVRMPKWSSGHVAIIGDAAVATMGVGTSYAIEGAFFLAGEISKINSASDIPAALENYERSLRPQIDQSVPTGLFQYVNPQTAWGIRIRNNIIWGILASGVYKLFIWFSEKFGRPNSKAKLPDYKWLD